MRSSVGTSGASSLVIALAVAAVLLAFPALSSATFAGRNGEIAFVQSLPGCCNNEIYAMKTTTAAIRWT